ncbi:hypothetical protein [Sporosarcina sp. FA9]|uniref:hypothetical protein n=1 Tax=Sporosarcina sp. FA9 TaxID=3413030 RepID=UPI003F6589A4
MNNKNVLKLFSIVLAATIVFYGTSTIGVFAMQNSASLKSFSGQTYVGPFDMTKLKGKSAKARLASNFEDLQSNFSGQLIYQDKVAELPVEIIEYDVDSTLEQMVHGDENPIYAKVSEDGLHTIIRQQFPLISFSDEDVTAIALSVEKELENGIMPARIYISDSLNENFSSTDVSSSSIKVPEVSSTVTKVMDSLNGTKIQSFSTFSLLDYIKTDNFGYISDDDLTVIASLLYTTILKTNFIVDERNIGERLHEDVAIGYEAAINQELSIDFIFTNPNKTTFTMQTNESNNVLTVSLLGMPFIYSYEVNASPITYYNPRKVIQFSAFVATGSIEVLEEGISGQEVNIIKTVYEGTNEIQSIAVSEDYYGPVHIIELHSLKKDEATESDTDTGSSPNELEPGLGSEYTNDEQTNDATEIDKENSGTDENEDIQYDKGGNIIN